MSYSGYYKTGYTSSRGRGYNSRGSYRSRGGGESTYYGRGSYRGRSSWQAEPSSSGYDSRSHYTSGSTSRGQTDDSGYHRYSRGEEADYSSHDRSYHSDSSRKRMRTDHGYVQTSTHRSHEGGYEGEDYNNRYYSGDKENYSYHDERRTSSSFRDRSRDDYSHLRKQEPLQVSMPTSSSRYMSSSRGSYRSRPRGMSIRGYRGAISKISYTRRPTSVFARRRTLTTLVDYRAGVRKRIVSTRTQADTLRKIRMAKLRRIRELTLKREALSRKLAREEAAKGTDDASEDDDDDENEKEDENEENGETKSPKKKTKVKKIVKKKSDDAAKDGDEDDDGEEEDADGGEDEEDEDDKEKAGETEVTKKKVASKTDDPSAKFKTRPFIKLACPHCYTWCVTFQEYNNHLYSFKHTNAVHKLWQLHKAVLTQLRAKQRKRQRLIDSQKESEDVTIKTKYCMVCKLNYGELKSEHVTSEYHKKILDFMRPYCRVCKYKLATPMLYEKHLCSLEHIKRKALLKFQKDGQEGKSKKDGSEAGGDEEKDLDLDNFMTLDSVGTFDDAGEENKKEGEDAPKEEKKKTKADLNPGSDHIKKLKVQYCELCRMYLTRSDKSDKAVAIHCQSRNHLAAYMRYHRRVERIERIEAEERRKKLLAKKKAAAAKKKAEDENEEKMDVDSTTAVENDTDAKEKSASKDKTSDAAGDALELDDEKMWADVDKDLGDILREVEPDNKSSDEDDEGGRYDRFKYSKKGKDSGKATEDGEDKSAEAENKEEEEEEGEAEDKPEAKSATPSPTKKSAAAAAASK